jgi:hypothetical protein
MNTFLSNPLLNMDKSPTSSNKFEAEFLMGIISILAIGLLFYNLYWWFLTK